MERYARGIALLALVAILFAVSGCDGGARVGALRTETETVELGGADSVRVEIEMGAGELEVSGGASELLEASFTYNVAELKPEVEMRGDRLFVRTPDVRVGIESLWDATDYRYEWDLRLNDDVPMEMEVGVGAGRSDLRLGTLNLTVLEVTRGAGEVYVDLSGAASLTRLKLGGGAGEATLDLTGDWQQDLYVTVDGGVGQRTLILPSDVGVRVKVDAGIGSVDAYGLTQDGDVYTNNAYGESDVTVDIQVDGGVGETELRVRE
jgi:hypothetical protein